MKKTERQKEQNRRYIEKNRERLRMDSRKCYWIKKGYAKEYINDLCEKHGEHAFTLLKNMNKGRTEIIKEQTDLKNKLATLQAKMEETINRLNFLESIPAC